ncbi:MAG: MmcQ/YjbR family DNA-binding protein [Pseudomonadales bacterium]|nr:MmcQ/YjbR family DNA-binding protein [Pseudomonadales bacterium]
MQSIKDYLGAKPESGEEYPFGDDIAVFKVRHKMFATFSENTQNLPLSADYKKIIQANEVNGVSVGCINLKCDPQQAIMLRDIFVAVIPGYHMNKVHWNTVVLDGSIPDGELQRMIDHSYTLVLQGMRQADRLQLEMHYSKTELYGP